MPALTGTVRAAGSTEPLAGAQVWAYRTVLWLERPLNAYEAPDTKSKVLGTLLPGVHPVSEIRFGRASDSDYVRVLAAAVPGGAGWICARWRRSTYALLDDEPLPGATTTSGTAGFSVHVEGTGLHLVRASSANHVDGESRRGAPGGAALAVELRGVPTSVPEARLVGLLHHFAGWYYTPVKERRQVAGVTRDVRYVPQYPYSIGVSVTLDKGHPEPPTYNDCCSFVEALVVKAWLDEKVSGFAWNLNKHRRAMLVDGAQRFSPVEVLEDNDVADNVDADALPPPWTVVQGWGATGHTFLIVDAHPATGRVLTLESNHSFWLNGPGFRRFAPLGRYVGEHWRCPTDGYVYDPQLGDPDHGVTPGTRFRATTRWDLEHGALVPSTWTCPSCDTAKDAFVAHCQPPRTWWRSSWLPTWEEIRARYPSRRMAALRLSNVRWVR